MPPWQSECVRVGPRNLRLKLGQNQVSNSWDTADIEFVVVVVWSHFRMKPKLRLVKVELGFWQQLSRVAASSRKNIYFKLVNYMTRMLASVHRYPCPAFFLPRPCWPKMIKCHQSTTPKRRATPYWPSVARQHPWPGPPTWGGGLVTLYHFWPARSERGRASKQPSQKKNLVGRCVYCQ